MTEILNLPEMPASPMFVGLKDVMTTEWQEFFRKIFNRVGGITGPDSDDTLLSLVSELFSTPRDFGKRIDELERKINAIPTPKSYDEIVNDILKQFHLFPDQKNYEKDISDLESIIISEAFKPSGEEEMEIFTSLGQLKIQKDLTFSNDTGTVNLFTVTGDVFVSIIPVITTDVVPNTSADISLGVTGNIDAMIVDSDSDDLDARGIWVDQTPDNEIEPTDRIRSYIITDGNDIILTLSAQVNSGAITFYCFWTPLSTDGNVEVA